MIAKHTSISVCLASFNGLPFIEQQIESIVDQLGPGDEVLITDDGSTDGTLEFLHSIEDSRIRVIRSPGFGNPVLNFEYGLSLVRNDTIFLSDHDDIWIPGKVRLMTEALQTATVAISDCNIIDGDGKVISESFFGLRRSGRGIFRNLVRNSYLGCCMAFRRSVLGVALPFPRGLPMHDWWLGLVGEMLGGAIFLEAKLTSYRRHGGNASSTAEASVRSVSRRISDRLILAGYLSARYLALLAKGRLA